MGQRAPGGQTGRRWANLHSKPPRRLEEGKAMKTTAAIVSIALSLLSPAHAGTYRCPPSAGGKPVFSDQAGPGCEPMSLRVIEPSAEEAAAARARLQRARDAASAPREPAPKDAAGPPTRAGEPDQRLPPRLQPERAYGPANPAPPAYDGPPEPIEIH